MTLEELEKELGIELPDSYRNLISNYPELLLAKGFHASEFELIKTPSQLLELNRLVRKIHEIEMEVGFFSIGESGCGDYYFIDVDEVDSPVYFWNHEIGEFDEDEESGNVEEHAGKILEVYRYVSKNT